MRQPAEPSDDGFTLVELLMAMAITAIITGVVGSALIVGLRTTDATAQRLNESHDAQLLSTNLIRDLQSVAEGGFDVAVGTGSGCPSTPAEGAYTGWRNVLSLTWSENTGSTDTYRASYRLGQQVAAEQSWQLVRVACRNGANTATQVVAHQLKAPAGAGTGPAVALDTTKAPTLAMTLTEPSGYTYTVAGKRRTPDSASLPAVVWECTVLSAVSKPDPATRSTVLAGPLKEDLKIEVQTGGACAGLRVSVQPNPATTDSVTLAEAPSGSGFWSSTISASKYAWTDGDKAFPIRDGGGTMLATLNLRVKQACIPSTFLATPTDARRVEAVSPSALSSAISLSVQTSGVCDALSVTYQPRAGTTESVLLTAGAAGSWTGTIPAAADQWSDGSVVLRLREAVGPDLATRTITVSPSCRVVTAVAAPNPAKTGVGQQKSQLLTDVTVTLTTEGACTGLTVTFQPGPSGSSSVTTPFKSAVAGTWTAVLSGTAHDWTPGLKPLTVRDAFGADLRTFDLVVS